VFVDLDHAKGNGTSFCVFGKRNGCCGRPSFV
jgi:hypothetical protein